VILGPRIEGQLRKTLKLSAGDPSGLLSEPIAVGIYVIVGVILLWPLLMRLWRKARPQTVPAFAGMHTFEEGTNVLDTNTAGTKAENRDADNMDDHATGFSQNTPARRRQEKP
jgi:putative tricarboxylic transport membrane protein